MQQGFSTLDLKVRFPTEFNSNLDQLTCLYISSNPVGLDSLVQVFD